MKRILTLSRYYLFIGGILLIVGFVLYLMLNKPNHKLPERALFVYIASY